MARIVSVEAVNSALALYEQAVINYLRTPCKELFDRVADAERICIKDCKIKRSQLLRIRMNCSNALEEVMNDAD